MKNITALLRNQHQNLPSVVRRAGRGRVKSLCWYQISLPRPVANSKQVAGNQTNEDLEVQKRPNEEEQLEVKKETWQDINKKQLTTSKTNIQPNSHRQLRLRNPSQTK